MINIEKADNIEKEYLQCTSCLKSKDDSKIFKIVIGKNINQITIIGLCEECMCNLSNNLQNFSQ